jgi:hypothetical protein
MEIPIMIKKQYKVSGNEIQMTLEDQLIMDDANLEWLD